MEYIFLNPEKGMALQKAGVSSSAAGVLGEHTIVGKSMEEFRKYNGLLPRCL